MSSTDIIITTGSVKVGRWTYPARVLRALGDLPVVVRNDKRDGSGVWLDADVESFVDEYGYTGSDAIEWHASRVASTNGTADHQPIVVEVPYAEMSKIDLAPIATPSPKPATPRSKVTWAIGTDCPNGHLLTEGSLYVMPSGRSQCRVCRKGHPSNASKPKAN